MAASADIPAVIHNDNLGDVLYGIDTNTVTVRDNDILSLRFLFSVDDGKIVVKEDSGLECCVLERLDNNNRTRISRSGAVLVDVTDESLRNAIDAIEFGFGISDFAKQVERDEEKNPGLKKMFVDVVVRLSGPDGNWDWFSFNDKGTHKRTSQPRAHKTEAPKHS